MNKEYLNKYKEIATILNSNISNHIKQTKYFNKLDEQVNKLLYKRFCEHNTSVDTKFCKIDGTITNYININDLIYKIELDLPQYRNIFDKIFQKSNNNLDLGLILINANSLDSSNNSGWYNGLYNNVLMSIHNYIMTKLVPKYVILMRHFYRLSKNYNEIILDIKLDDYKSYAYKLNREYFEKNRQQSDYSIISKNNIIDEYVINNSNKELPLYKKLLQLFYKTNSIEAVTLLASKIEKDLIYIKLEKKFNLLKKNNTNFSKEQVVLINSIINFKVTFNKNWKIYFVRKNVNINNLERNIKYVPFYLFYKIQKQEFIELNENFHIKTVNNFNNWYIDEKINNQETSLGIIYFTEYERTKNIFFISFFLILIIFLLFSIRRKIER